MRRNLIVFTWILFGGLVSILDSCDCHRTDVFYYDDYYPNTSGYPYLEGEEFQGDGEIYMDKRKPAFTPYVSVGALSNLKRFFETLKENFNSLENILPNERKQSAEKQDYSIDGGRRIFNDPPATAAFLHSARNHGLPGRAKNSMAQFQPSSLRRGSFHQYRPAMLWGKRKS